MGAVRLARHREGDRAASRAWHDEKFSFFGAPVGLIFTLNRRLGLGSFIDLGMFMEAVAIGARAFGLDSRPQAAFAHYHAIIRPTLSLAPDEMVVCGMALGFADENVVADKLRTPREPATGFVALHPPDLGPPDVHRTDPGAEQNG